MVFTPCDGIVGVGLWVVNGNWEAVLLAVFVCFRGSLTVERVA